MDFIIKYGRCCSLTEENLMKRHVSSNSYPMANNLITSLMI